MKSIYPCVILVPLLFASCATPLDRIVEQHHQQRLDSANAGHPLGYGASDGLGQHIAESNARLTLDHVDRP